MDLSEFIQSEYFTKAIYALGGVFVTWFTQQLLNKRGTFTYYVNHNRIAMAAEDAIFGKVGVTLNGHNYPNLYLSTVELVNESMNDYEQVIVHSYTSNTRLLTEQTTIVGTPKILDWSDHYRLQLATDEGQDPSENQWEIYFGQREYMIPVINRGQVIRLTYLNSATTNETPSIWLDVSKKGVKLKFRPPQQTVLGVSQQRAACIGVVVGILLIWLLINSNLELWLTVTLAFTYGLIAQLPGALIIKSWRKLREVMSG